MMNGYAIPRDFGFLPAAGPGLSACSDLSVNEPDLDHGKGRRPPRGGDKRRPEEFLFRHWGSDPCVNGELDTPP